jgi:hypothetical protein
MKRQRGFTELVTQIIAGVSVSAVISFGSIIVIGYAKGQQLDRIEQTQVDINARLERMEGNQLETRERLSRLEGSLGSRLDARR